MKNLTTLGAVVLFLVFGLLLVTQFHTTAAQESQGPPKDMADYEFFEKEYHRPNRSEAPTPNQDIEPQSGPLDYTLLTFMSARDNNWEIYRSDRYGYQLARLTNNDSSDITPRLNRGSTRIVFASNRSGNYEIYSMNRYGSDVRQLTNNPAADSNPAWSFDGTSIVFVSERDGQSEIYKMKADGSGQTRLTYHADFDGDPWWSPDGNNIVFASRRNGDGIWLMDANGGNQHMLVQRQYSQNPVWSPDGSTIAFDADGSGDGWQEIWLMNPDGSNQRILHSFGERYDPYVSGWSPDGSKVTFTLTYWTYYQGNWYWVYAKPYWVGLDGSANYFNYNFTEDWYPNWQSTDIIPPTSAVQPLPTYSGDEIAVHWSGSDDGGSGIAKYDIQFKQGSSGAWQDWYIGTSSTSGVFGTIPGKTVYFRSRAYDKAGLVEGWPPGNGDAYTTFYSWKISGVAMDNRLLPLPHVVVTTTQEYFELVPSDDQGEYAAYFASSDPDFTVTFARDGYGTPVTTTFPSQEIAELDILMPPADNIIAEPDFEIANFGGTEWSASGQYTPTLNSEQRHTGENSVFFGQEPGLGNVAHFPADISFVDKAAPEQYTSSQFDALWRKAIPASSMDMVQSRTLLSDADGESRLEQQLIIPAEITHPTLSFVTLQGPNAADPELGLKVLIHDGITETNIFTGTWHTGWTYNWLDLEQWSGQEITLTFALQQKEGKEAAWAYLDEVYLGSAYPDSWLNVDSPPIVAPGSQADLTIHYGNRSDIPATGLTLTAIFTDDLDFVSATPEPSYQAAGQLEWDLGEASAGDGQGTINLTIEVPEGTASWQVIQLAFELVGDIDEPASENNTQMIELKIYYGNFLPLIAR